MDERIIPTIVLALNFLSAIGFLFFQFFVDLSALLTIASWLMLVVVAYWVYENDHRTEFLEKNVWKKMEKSEAKLEIAYRKIAELEKEIKDLNTKTK